MGTPKIGISKEGKEMHYSVGAFVKKDDEILLVDRLKTPYGFAGIAGHVDMGETKEETLIREVKEESGLTVGDYNLVFEEEVKGNVCNRRVDTHYWYVFDCEASGNIKLNRLEAKSIGWYPPTKIRELTLEPIWDYWFKKLKVI